MKSLLSKVSGGAAAPDPKKPLTPSEQLQQLKKIVGDLQGRIRCLAEEIQELRKHCQGARSEVQGKIDQAGAGSLPAGVDVKALQRDLDAVERGGPPRADPSATKVAPGAPPREVVSKLQQRVRDLLVEKQYWVERKEMYGQLTARCSGAAPAAAATPTADPLADLGLVDTPQQTELEPGAAGAAAAADKGKRFTRTLPRTSMGPGGKPTGKISTWKKSGRDRGATGVAKAPAAPAAEGADDGLGDLEL
eukprot:TRINITY_DN57092_c0_g1_i1.p1 TRINITY_DN57092_c0_g1~~TRINITY_DN57092_c0_g1_i1.p1  ORF type:complete len:273 (+),score=98.79 TRINITY_DN57092_c0_g1_i1:74-820(+)